MNETYGVNTDRLNEDVDAVLDELRELKADKRLEKIMGEDVRKIKEWEAVIKRRRTEPFNILIMGDFKRGKSTLINALLGDYIVPTASLPETMTINKITYGEMPSYKAVMKNGREASLKPENITRTELQKLLKELPSEIDYLDIRVNNELLKEINIVDTPGLGDLFAQFDEQVTDYLKNADAIIYVSSAMYPLSESERSYLSTAVMPQGFSRMFMVVNMADSMDSESDVMRISKMAKERVLEINPNAAVFVISALDEYCRVKGLTRPNKILEAMLENNFMFLQTALNSDIITQRDVIKSSRIASVARLSLDAIMNRIDIYCNMLHMEETDLDALKERYTKESSTLSGKIEKEITKLDLDINDMLHEAEAWMEEFMQRLNVEIENARSTASTEQLQKHFQFYMTDKIKVAVSSCVNLHREKINVKIEESARSLSMEMMGSFSSDTAEAKIAENLADMAWTKADTAMFAADLFVNVTGLNLGPLMLLGMGIAGMVRKKSQKSEDYLVPILENYRSITDSVLNELNGIYKKLKTDSSEILKELYSEQMKQSLATVTQAADVMSDRTVDIEETIGYLNGVKEKLLPLRDTIAGYL